MMNLQMEDDQVQNIKGYLNLAWDALHEEIYFILRKLDISGCLIVKFSITENSTVFSPKFAKLN